MNMTVCVVVPVPCKDLNPKNDSLRFPEPGVIVTADTRFTITLMDGRKTYQDNGLKVGQFSEFAIAGFAGDVQLVENALSKLQSEIAQLSISRPKKIPPRAQRLLNQSKGSLDGNRPKQPTEVIIALRDDRGRFWTYLLSSRDNFVPTRITGISAIGSGAKEFVNTFKSEVEWITASLGERSRKPQVIQEGDNFRVMPAQPTHRYDVSLIEVANLVNGLAMDQILEHTELTSIGGKTQSLVLTTHGVNRLGGFKSTDDGETWSSIHPVDPLRSSSEMNLWRK